MRQHPRVQESDIVIIGGGATGAGVARDCARRGLRCVLVERQDFSSGATGRNHGLLHSGARYAVTDQESAKECITENAILRRIARHCIEETDGLFISLPEDGLDYQKTLIAACHTAGINAAAIEPQQALRIEPAVNPKLIGAVLVPDAVIDPFRLTMANILDATAHGAVCHTYHQVTAITSNGGKVTGVRVYDHAACESYDIKAPIVVNAAGIWGHLIAKLAGVTVSMFPTKGSLLILGHKLNRTVINRCRKPSDADILVPGDTVSLIGTTSVPVDFADLDTLRTTADEVDILIREGSLLAPQLATTRKIRCYAGSRPLVADDSDPTGRTISRKIVLLDHAERDGLEGFITISGGKLITYRLMAEMTTDLICRKLGSSAVCDTASAVLPGSQDVEALKQKRHISPVPERSLIPPVQWSALLDRHGDMAMSMASDPDYDHSLVCECEAVSAGEVKFAVENLSVRTLTDLRRRTRVGMGPCQGEMCACRAAGLLVRHGAVSQEDILSELADFLEERWKGVRPLAWGDALRESEFTQWVYRGVCGLTHKDVRPLPPECEHTESV